MDHEILQINCSGPCWVGGPIFWSEIYSVDPLSEISPGPKLVDPEFGPVCGPKFLRLKRTGLKIASDVGDNVLSIMLTDLRCWWQNWSPLDLIGQQYDIDNIP